VSIESKDVVDGVMTVTEEVGDRARRRFGREELTNVVAQRQYSYQVWWNKRDGKWCPKKGEKPSDLKKAAAWKTPSGEDIEIWCFLVPVESMTRYGFKKPTHYIGTRRKQGTRVEGRENGARAAAPAATALLAAPATVVVNAPVEEIVRPVEIVGDEAPKSSPVNDIPESKPRLMDLD
jgi:hypothetical protein